MSMLRLLAVIEAYTITGPAKNLLEFARSSRESGIDTTIATFTREASSNLFIETAQSYGIPVETIRERSAYDSAALRALAETVDRLRPDIVQTHAVKSHFLARRAGLPQRTPWVAFHHGYTWPTLKARLYNQLDRWSLRQAGKVLTVSEPYRDELVAHGVDKGQIEIVHNAIPAGWGKSQVDASAVTRAQLGIADDRKLILIVGRLSREKDHLTLLEAVSRLPPEVQPHLLVVGEGPERGRIEQSVARLGLREQVTLVGQQNSAEPYYRIADIVAISSLQEGSPNALLEAMAAGVPVVATAVGGIPEIVEDGVSALLVGSKDAAGMAAAIGRLFNDPQLARKLVGRSADLIRERHAPEARVRRLAGIYRGMLP